MRTQLVERPSRTDEYRNQAAMLRLQAKQTRFADTAIRLTALADSFDLLADRVEQRETAIANAAD